MTEHRISKDAGVLEDILQHEGMQVDFDYDYLKGDPGCRTLPNGDPGWPPSPPEITLNAVWIYRPDKPLERVDIYPAIDAKAVEIIETRLYEEHDSDLDGGC